MTLKVPRGHFSGSTLTLHFARGSEAIRERALRTRNLQVFCFWPEGNFGNGSTFIDLRLTPAKRTQVLVAAARGSSGGYSCGLGARPRSIPQWPATAFLRRAIVDVQLSHSNR